MNLARALARRARSIRVRLTVWYVVLLAIILVVFSAVLYASLARSLSQQLDLSLTTEAERLVASLDVENGALQLAEGPDNMRVGTVAALYDRRGLQLLAYDPRQPLPAMPQALTQAAAGQQTFMTAALPDGTQWRVLTIPVTQNNVQIAVLQVGRPLDDVDSTLHALALVLLLAVPLTLVVASAGGLFLAGRALDPIDRITRAAGAISAEDLSRRLNWRGSQDEVGRLAQTFDGMLNRLEQAFKRQRQFTADASHELRTPLAMLASQIDVALERDRTPAEYTELLTSLREDTARMSRLVGELLTLARADNGQQLLSREALDLGELVKSVVFALQPLAAERGVQLHQDAAPDVSILGDQMRLTQLVINLVDNAIRYTPADGSVRVSVLREANWALLRVADTGAGIDPEHLPHVFERFYRADTSRARADGGTGLGLAIARWVAQAHAGDISVVSTPGQGTTFTVRLPAHANMKDFSSVSQATFRSGSDSEGERTTERLDLA